MKIYKNLFCDIISAENLFSAWDKFKNGKRKKKDVRLFEWNLEENIFKLHRELKSRTYRHSAYTSFNISDPKPRNIHKAQVRDRILHHAVFQILNPILEASFISASFSCREGYGTHKGVQFLQNTLRKASKNGKVPCFVLKCDIRRFFDTIDHKILLAILKKKVKDGDTVWLLEKIISSFTSKYSLLGVNKGVPIGNLTSQLFANIYLNELDVFVKQKLKVKYYLRYTDDFLIVSGDRGYLEKIIPEIMDFLEKELSLKIHPEKVGIRKISQGIDFLGYIAFISYMLVRTKTKKRMFKKFRAKIEDYKNGVISKNSLLQSLQSYLGFLSHAETYNLQQYLKNQFLLLLK
jgi:retron-type reverse transcriptase